MATRSAARPDLGALRVTVLKALENCATEADMAQVLYQTLRPALGYEVIGLQVLEREGWYHAVGVDEGVLQDRLRRQLSETFAGPLYAAGVPAVLHPERDFLNTSRGPGGERVPRTVIWIPLERQGSILGGVLYQTYADRDVPAPELRFLVDLNSQMAALVANAYLNEVTRDQAVRLAALNAVARELASTRDEAGVLGALLRTLRQLVPVDAVQIATRLADGQVRLRERSGPDDRLREIETRAGGTSAARKVLNGGPARVGRGRDRSAIWVPVREGGDVVAALSVMARDPGAYEMSTVSFLEQVADQVAIALRNAANYAAVEDQRRRLEVVNAVGRHLASSLDRWSIMRILREELARHLKFDIFIMATIREGSEGAVAEGYAYDSGEEQRVPPVPLAVTGPSREAYSTGRPVLVTDSPWAKAVEEHRPAEQTWVLGDGAAVFVTPRRGRRRLAARSFVWVPVLRDERVEALLSLQSYQPDVFGPDEVRLLEDVAAHVSLALTNAEHFATAQAERRRLEALHEVELGIAAVDPSQPAQARIQLGRLVERALASWSGGMWLLEGDELLREPEAADGLLSRVPWEPDPARMAAACLPGAGSPCAELLMVSDRAAGILVADVANEAEDGHRLLDLLTAQVAAVLGRVRLIEAKDLMLRAIGHEIRGPAAAMRATLASVVQWQASMDAERRALLLGEAYEMSDRLLSLVEAQLLVARLETGAYLPAVAPIEVGAAMAQVLRVLWHRYGERTARVSVELPPGLPAALCEATHLGQVLMNLVGNALEYGGNARVRVSARQVGSRLLVTVADQGPGIASDRRPSLFLKAAAGQNPRGGGLGLGLHLCALVVERSFGGKIWIEDTRRGATFKFTVPAALDE